MKRKTVLLLLVLGVAIGVLVAPGVALASWSDISDAAWVSQYGVTAAQVDTVADGYPDGTFKPSAQVTRGQFTKMAVNGLGVPVLSPLTPTFSDVPRTHIFYTHIEGANAAGLVNGVGGGLFTPSAPISRQQVATILARWLSEAELDALGYIAGPAGTQYPSLSAWYAAQGATALASFFDQASIATVHRPGVAYLAARGIAQGSSGYFTPMSNITRAQAAVLVLRVLDESDDFAVLTPTVTDVNPDNGPATGGTTVVITGTNFTAGATVKFGAVSATGVDGRQRDADHGRLTRRHRRHHGAGRGNHRGRHQCQHSGRQLHLQRRPNGHHQPGGVSGRPDSYVAHQLHRRVQRDSH